jgi:hypothetical protein
MDGSRNLIEPSKKHKYKKLFRAASDFSTYIPAETGINAHCSALEVYHTMQDWNKGQI